MELDREIGELQIVIERKRTKQKKKGTAVPIRALRTVPLM